jgi:hypothetical protein
MSWRPAAHRCGRHGPGSMKNTDTKRGCGVRPLPECERLRGTSANAQPAVDEERAPAKRRLGAAPLLDPSKQLSEAAQLLLGA